MADTTNSNFSSADIENKLSIDRHLHNKWLISLYDSKFNNPEMVLKTSILARMLPLEDNVLPTEDSFEGLEDTV